MTRVALALMFLCSCSQKPASDPKFDSEWAELSKGGAEPMFVEGGPHGAGLMGEVRRAVDPATDLNRAPSSFQGPLPDPEVVRVIRGNLGGVKGCYALEEKNGTVGSGKAIVSLEIDPSGAVSTVQVLAPAFANSGLSSCMSARAKSWTFPKFTSGPKKFSYPFVFVGS
jgi:hypothetical protein